MEVKRRLYPDGTTIVCSSNLQLQPFLARIIKLPCSPLVAVGFYHGVCRRSDVGDFWKHTMSEVTALPREFIKGGRLFHVAWHPGYTTSEL